VPALLLVGLLIRQREESSQMRRATDRAQEVMGGRAEIAEVLAHEVRGPAASIKSLAATTAGSYDRLSDAERREFVGLIEAEARRLLDTVSQASLALKVDAGTLGFVRRPLDLAGVVEEAIDAAGVSDRAVKAELDPGITVPGDRLHLGEAIRQAVSNADRFSPPGAEIGVRVSADGASAVVEVLDRGPGIPPERREEVFGRFVRWRPDGFEDRQGAGLGLFICRGIVREHGGDVTVEGPDGGGTMLRIRLPREA
jgi:two-component system sensor histidine kinase KdpD